MAKKKSTPQKRGPKPLYNDEELVNNLLDSLRVGLLEHEAAEVAGINAETLRRWKHKPEIGGAIKRAIIEGKRHHLVRIFQGVVGWQSSAWFLERKYRNEFGKDVAPPAPSEVVVKFADDEE